MRWADGVPSTEERRHRTAYDNGLRQSDLGQGHTKQGDGEARVARGLRARVLEACGECTRSKGEVADGVRQGRHCRRVEDRRQGMDALRGIAEEDLARGPGQHEGRRATPRLRAAARRPENLEQVRRHQDPRHRWPRCARRLFQVHV